MVSITARKFWDNGIFLSDAWFALADEKTRMKFRNLPGFSKAINQFAEIEKMADWSGLFKAISVGTDASRQRLELSDLMKEHLLIQLFNSQLVATGFREFPSLSSNAVRIDADHFDDGNPDWENSKFTANGRKWGLIKISPLSILVKRKSKGSREAIIQAIRELSLGGLNFNSITRKAGAQLIRVKLCREYEKGNGLSDVNLAKIIVEECGEKGIS